MITIYDDNGLAVILKILELTVTLCKGVGVGKRNNKIILKISAHDKLKYL